MVQGTKNLWDIAFAKAKEPDPSCPYCVTTGDPDPQTAAEKICATSKDQEKCVSVLSGMGHVEDREGYDALGNRLKAMAGETQLVHSFLQHAEKAWWKKPGETGGATLSSPPGPNLPDAPPSKPAPTDAPKT